MRSWSIPIGRLFNVDFRLHIGFLFLLLFTVFLPPANVPGHTIGRAVALTSIVLASVLAHEFGHLIVALWQGQRPRIVMLYPLAGVPIYGDDGRTLIDRRFETLYSLSGPLVNIVLAFLGAAIYYAAVPGANLTVEPLVHTSDLARSFVWINIALAALNLVPAYPLDGGRLLRAGFSADRDYFSATRSAVGIGQGFAMFFILLGFWNAWFSLIGLFLFFAAQLEERNMVFNTVVDSVTMRDVMLTDFSTLSPADTLEDALQRAVHSLQDDFPVIRGGDLVGVISRSRIMQALRAEGNGYVQSAMSKAFETGEAEDSIASAFKKITSRGVTLIPVVENQRLVGIVTLQNLMHSMKLLAESKGLRSSQKL